MTPAPTSDGELDPRFHATIRTEQALLGELLHRAIDARTDPAPGGPHHRAATRSGPAHRNAVAALSHWGLRASDFLRPYHQQVYAAMQRLTKASTSIRPHTVRAELANDPDIPTHLALDGVRLLNLMAAATAQTDLTSLTALVLDCSTRRRVTLWGLRLAEAARSLPDDLFTRPGPPPHADTVPLLVGDIHVIRHDLHRWRHRWTRLPIQVRHHLDTTPPPRTDSARTIDAASTALDTRHRHDTVDLLRHEVDVVAGIATHTRHLEEIRRWLRPEHFTTRHGRTLFELLLERTDRGQGIDPLTLAWMAQRHGLEAVAAQRTLLDALHDGQPWVHDTASRLHAHAVREAAIDTARRIATLAAGPEGPQRLLTGIDHLLIQLLRTAEAGHDSAQRRPAEAARQPSRRSRLRTAPPNTPSRSDHGPTVAGRPQPMP
ncbi:DnaB-like helicase N-terminal domain-containing protein [Thermomonospora umbrina]|uniref:DnaB helicase-like protein n=1 Tax=Thermomonospora umbrina TaxID=111806 RepID=A0A3D9T123_9ACTN|nr:DnaB-like helicase N-terminal domain-containing protein [Thermomonospora umbrina]REF00521.1 DnaB helicase-like protein [Thermomonospora umbrina]